MGGSAVPDLRSPAAEVTNLRRQVRELQLRIRASRAAGNGGRPELAARIEALRAEIVERFGEDQLPSPYGVDRCTAVGVRSPNPITKSPTRWTTRCPDCGRIANVHMPRVNILPRIGAH
jgi:hypothetical protein